MIQKGMRLPVVANLLLAGKTDWLDMTEFFSSVGDLGVHDLESNRALALGLIRDLLFRGLIVAGDVETTFVSWSLGPAESFEIIANACYGRWAGEFPESGDVASFDLTAAGEAIVADLVEKNEPLEGFATK